MKKGSTIGIVTSIKHSSNPKENIYTVMGEKSHAIKSGTILELYDTVTVDNAALAAGQADREHITIDEKATPETYKTVLYDRINALKILSKTRKPDISVKEFEEPTAKMLQKMKNAAFEIARSLVTGSPILVRFHNDCDGASGATALYNAIEKIVEKYGPKEPAVAWRMNKSISYGKESYFSDYAYFNNYSSTEKPTVLISDFGTTNESEEAIDLCEMKYNLVWIDHHPVYNGFPRHKIRHYINPWDSGGDSDYTAGYLLSAFAELLVPIDVKKYKTASLIGDYSRHAKRSDKEGSKLAIVLDYLTSKKDESNNLTPKYITSIINDKPKFNEMAERASSLLDEAIELGVSKVKHTKSRSGMDIYVLDFRHITKGDDYPLPGRYSSRLQDKMQEVGGNKRTITLVHYGNYISIRSSKEAAEHARLHEIAEEMKNNDDGIHSFGGHSNAFGIRADKERAGEIAKMFSKQLELI